MNTLRRALTVNFLYFQVVNFRAFNGKAYKRNFIVKAIFTGSTGVDMQKVVFAVGHHLQDMRMATYKQTRLFPFNHGQGSRRIPARITSNMGNEYFQAFAIKNKVFRKIYPDQVIVNISINGPEGFKGGEFIR